MWRCDFPVRLCIAVFALHTLDKTCFARAIGFLYQCVGIGHCRRQDFRFYTKYEEAK